MTWTIDDLYKLDLKFAKEGVHAHQRPFHAATELLGASFSLGIGGNPEVQMIMDAYAEMFPEANKSWPGMGIGLAVSVDQVRKLVAPVIFGSIGGPIEVWKSLGFQTEENWWHWCRKDHDIAAESHFSFADLFDFTYGVDDLKQTRPEAHTLWHMAASNLGDVANALPNLFSVDTMIQPICMIVELSLKAALVFNGADPNDFKGREGHNLVDLTKRMSNELPHRDDTLVQVIVAKLPPYVKSRYEPAGLRRLDVARFSLAVQFVAASTARRLSERDMAFQMEAGDWPGPRRPFFT